MRLFIVLGCLCWSLSTFAQFEYLSVIPIDSTAKQILVETEIKNQINSREDLFTQIELLLKSAHKNGFLTASIDSFYADSSTTFVHFYAGNKYTWAQISPDSLATLWLNETNSYLKIKPLMPVYQYEFVALIDRLLRYGENHGYPFAYAFLDNVATDSQNRISADLILKPFRFFAFNSIQIVGDAKISDKYLQQYLGIKNGEPYNESLVKKMDEKLQKLPFCSVEKNSKIFFKDDKVRLVVFLKHRKTDRFDGIVGFAPNASNNNKLLITGEANIDLKNLLKRGIGYSMHWKSFNERSQQLEMAGQIPYFLKSPIGADAQVEYLKFDTLFFTVKTKIGLNYFFSGNDFAQFYIKRNQSALLHIDTNLVRQSGRLPASNPVNSIAYGCQISHQKLDYIYNPRKGFSVQLNANVGVRSIVKEFQIQQVVFKNALNEQYNVYDSVKLKSLQGEFQYSFSLYLPIAKKSTFVSGLYGKRLVAENIFVNDLYRFGGTKSLRGFNEESLQANSYTVLNLEYRYILGGNAFFQLFGNIGYMQDKSNPETGIKTDYPYGFGTGVNLDVNNGILTLAYALGTQQGNPIKLNQAKIHFGIINYL
ncbi:MAG: POTRA domain-containing protein [Bacteroidia bacterium]